MHRDACFLLSLVPSNNRLRSLHAKLGPLLVQLEEVSKDPSAAHTPRFATKRLSDVEKGVKKLHNEATGKLRESALEPLSFGMESVTEVNKEGAEALKLAKTYLDTAKKHVS